MNRLSREFGVCIFSAVCCFAQTPVPLGASANFAVLGHTTVTNTGTSIIQGSVGLSPGTVITGFPPGVVTSGSLHADDPPATQAETDLATAYSHAAGEAMTQDLTGQNLGGLTLGPGVYHFSTAAQLTGTLTLDGGGNNNAIFVFQIGTTLTTASASLIVAQNGAEAANIFWQVGSSATLGTSSTFIGNILAFTSVTSTTSVVAAGRLLALNGAVTLDTITINYPPAIPAGGLGGAPLPPPPPPTPVPSSWILLLIGLACAALYQSRERWLRPRA